MESDANLKFEVDTDGGSASVAVGSVWAFTRHDGSPVLTRQCSNYTEIEREISRLESELEDVRRNAASHFGAEDAPATAESATATQSAEEPAKGQMATLVDLLEGSRVRDVMTAKVETVAPNDRLKIADEMMRAGRFRHLVVCDDGEVVGVVSQRDIVLAGISWALGIGKAAHEKALEVCSVKEVMTSRITTVDPDAPLQEAAEVMAAHKIGCLPVVAGGQLAGILTEGDFVAMLRVKSG